MYFDYEKKIVVEINTLNYIVARVLSQYNEKEVLYPYIYFSKKFQPA